MHPSIVSNCIHHLSNTFTMAYLIDRPSGQIRAILSSSAVRGAVVAASYQKPGGVSVRDSRL
jgi:hypothetical protein